MTPRAVLFDLDETLLDNSPARAVLVAACAEIALTFDGLTTERLARANQEAFSAYWSEVEPLWTLGEMASDALSIEVWRRALRTCGVEADGAAASAAKIFGRHTEAARRLFDDVLPLLDHLRGRFPLGVITNGAADLQRGKLQSLGIEPHFAAVAISGELGLAKPDAGIFRFAIDKLGFAASEVWMVGDSLTNDIGGAKAAGLTAVWLNRTGHKRIATDPEPDIEIRSLIELLPLIEETL